MKVLYVDDEPDIREVAEMSLQLDPHFEVRTCGGGEEALNVLATWSPDVVLLDVMMPRMDGPATLAEIRKGERNADVPVIFITARTQVEDVRRLFGLGAVGVIAKPFEPLELADRVNRCLEEAVHDG